LFVEVEEVRVGGGGGGETVGFAGRFEASEKGFGVVDVLWEWLAETKR
jgi:hypothetical protein